MLLQRVLKIGSWSILFKGQYHKTTKQASFISIGESKTSKLSVLNKDNIDRKEFYGQKKHCSP